MGLKKTYFNQFWKNKKVFVTGHTGFKGGWLSLWLKKLGAKVKGFSLQPSTKPSFFNAVDLRNEINSEFGNINNFKKLSHSINSFNPDMIFHLAAQPLVIDSYKLPLNTYLTNVIGTLNLLEITKSNGNVKALLNVTSDKCYENINLKKNYNETDPMGGFDPYSSSKACSEILTSSYRRSFFSDRKQTNIATARAGNVIGGGDWSHSRLIPDILESIINDKKLTLRNPKSIRPWQFILDPLYGYLLLAIKLHNKGNTYAEAWNFGPNKKNLKNVEWITNKMFDLWGKEKYFKKSKKIFHEENYLSLDSRKSNKKLFWKPSYDINTSLIKIIAWHKAFKNKKNMNEFSKKQIMEFMKFKNI